VAFCNNSVKDATARPETNKTNFEYLPNEFFMIPPNANHAENGNGKYIIKWITLSASKPSILNDKSTWVSLNEYKDKKRSMEMYNANNILNKNLVVFIKKQLLKVKLS
jgi:hypothetical protein